MIVFLVEIFLVTKPDQSSLLFDLKKTSHVLLDSMRNKNNTTVALMNSSTYDEYESRGWVILESFPLHEEILIPVQNETCKV